MRFAFEGTGDGRDETVGERAASADAAHAYADIAEKPNGHVDAAEVLALYEEYLRELDKVPTLRDPVLPDTSGPHFNLDEKIREIVRDELAKLQGQGEAPKRGSARSRKRRKR